MATVVDAFPVVFAEVKQVRETINTYCLAPDTVPTSLDDIAYAVRELYGCELETHLVPIDSPVLRGMIEIYKDKAIIYVDADLNKGWTRYVFAKEACHVMILNGDNATTDPGAIIEYFVRGGELADGAVLTKAMVSEHAAMFGAVELLFPRDLREAAKRRLSAGEDTLFTLSEWLEIPEFLVELALSDRYRDLTAKAWAQV